MAQLLNEERIRRPLAQPISRMLDAALAAASESGAALRSAMLYGSVAGKNFIPGKSDVNILLVFDKLTLDLLRRLREVFRRHERDFRGRPVALDAEYISDSRDVFPMEFLEWQERHILIYGENLLIGLEISTENLRLQIEENLRGKKMRLIQSFFEMDGRRARLQPFMESTLPGFIVYLRNILRLLGVPVSDDVPSMLTVVEERTGAPLRNIRRLFQCRADNLRLGTEEAELLFQGYLTDIDGIITYVDKFR